MSPTTVPPSSETEIRDLLEAVRGGDEGARDVLFERLYGELKRLAAGHLQGERAWRERQGGTLTPTALVHETYLRLAETPLRGEDRRQFFALASRAMGHILIDGARRRRAGKRRGEIVTWNEEVLPGMERDAYLVELEGALAALAAHDAELARLVELRFFGGFSIVETAELLEVSAPTVKRRWRLARAWLHRHIAGPTGEGRDTL